jgi:DNA modification methylase
MPEPAPSSQIDTRTILLINILPHPRNYREHGEDQLEVIKDSLQFYGQVGTVTVKSRPDGTYTLLTGHSVYLAAKQTGRADLLCRVVPDDWSEQKCLAFMVMDNKSRELGLDNPEKLTDLLQNELSDSEYLQHLGLDENDLNEFWPAPSALPDELAVYQNYDPEEAAEPNPTAPPREKDAGFSEDGAAIGWDENAPQAGGDDFEVPALDGDSETTPAPGQPPPLEIPPRTQGGDVWQLGIHRLVVGSALDRQTVAACLFGLKDGPRGPVIDLVWTDPPYGVAYVGKTKEALTIQNDKLDESNLDSFLRQAFTIALEYCREGAVWYVASPPGPLMLIFGGLLRELKVLRQSIVWGKNRFVLGHNDFHYRHEFIFYGWKDGAAHFIIKDRTLDTLWLIDRPGRNADHPTMKPVQLILRSLKYSTQSGNIVYDPFGGSGTTLIGCERSKRICRTIELSPRYADVILKRWEMETGREAEWLGNLDGAAQLAWERPAVQEETELNKDYEAEFDAA